MKHTYTKAEDALKALYDKITDWFEVEDWTDPHKGLTEVEAHFNALDKGMEAWSAMTDRVAAAERERDKWHDAVNEYRPAWERETIRADAAEAECDRLREKVADIEEGALHASYSLTDEERKKWDAVKAYEDTAQELHECQTERDRLREQLRLSIIDAANNEAEANELRPLAIGGDGSTHWYYREEVLCKYISATPALLSLLYDTDLLPEQTQGTRDFGRTMLIAAYWRKEFRHGKAK